MQTVHTQIKLLLKKQVWSESALFVIPQIILRNNYIKKQKLGKNVWISFRTFTIIYRKFSEQNCLLLKAAYLIQAFHNVTLWND